VHVALLPCGPPFPADLGTEVLHAVGLTPQERVQVDAAV